MAEWISPIRPKLVKQLVNSYMHIPNQCIYHIPTGNKIISKCRVFHFHLSLKEIHLKLSSHQNQNVFDQIHLWFNLHHLWVHMLQSVLLKISVQRKKSLSKRHSFWKFRFLFHVVTFIFINDFVVFHYF